MELNKYIDIKNQVIDTLVKQNYIYIENTLLNTNIKKDEGVISRTKIVFKRHPLLYDNVTYIEYTYSVLDVFKPEGVFETLAIIPIELNEFTVTTIKELIGMD